MPIQNLKISPPFKNVDETSLTSELVEIQDAYLNDKAGLVKKPGLKLFCDLGTNKKIDGLFWSDTKECLIAVSDGKTFKINDKYGVKTELTGFELNKGQRVNFAEAFYNSTLYLFMVNGSGLIFTDYTEDTQKLSSTSTPSLSGTGAPPSNITSFCNFNTYLVCNSEGSNSWFFSYPNNPFSWDVSDSYDAEKSTDSVDLIKVLNNRLLICGKNSIEPWYNAGTPGDPLLRSLNASFVNAGVIAPNSATAVNEDKMYFLNKDRKLASIQGKAYEVLSRSYDKEFQKLSSVADANSFVLNEGGKSFFIINFPEAKKTFVYDLDLQVFYEWSTWDEASGTYDIFKGNCYAYAKKWNQHLIGGHDGKIYQVSSEFQTDDGNTIRSRILTGHINYGSDAILKQSSRLVGRFKRGVGKSDNEYEKPYFLIRKRKNGKKQWGNFKKISLGALGETELSKTIYRRNGRYFTMQYELVFPDDAPFVLSGIWEDVKGLQ